jgi:hypothetical protein
MILPYISNGMGFIPAREEPSVYGDKVDYSKLPSTHLKSEKTEKHIRTRIYQLNVLHKTIADPLNPDTIFTYDSA